jgi:hypothetical protein
VRSSVLEETPCFRRRQGLQFLGPPIAPVTVLPAGLLVHFAGMANQFIQAVRNFPKYLFERRPS